MGGLECETGDGREIHDTSEFGETRNVKRETWGAGTGGEICSGLVFKCDEFMDKIENASGKKYWRLQLEQFAQGVKDKGCDCWCFHFSLAFSEFLRFLYSATSSRMALNVA